MGKSGGKIIFKYSYQNKKKNVQGLDILVYENEWNDMKAL